MLLPNASGLIGNTTTKAARHDGLVVVSPSWDCGG